MRVQPNILKISTRVGLCMIADGCVRKKVVKRFRSERAGDEEPYPRTTRLYIFAVSATVEQTVEQPPRTSSLVGGL